MEQSTNRLLVKDGNEMSDGVVQKNHRYRSNSDRCYWCNATLNNTPCSPQKRTRDHLIPRSKGGTFLANNIVPACLECNNRRGDDTSWIPFHERISVVSVDDGPPPVPTDGWAIWIEGYRTNGQIGYATLLGSVIAPTFHAACDIFFSSRSDRDLYSQASPGQPPSLWGCRLFDNEKAARRIFG